MKNFKVSILVLAVGLICAAVLASDEKPWFDLKNCAFCKNFDLGNGVYIVDHMKTEYHDLPNGFFSITTIDPAWQDKFDKAMAGMTEAVKDAQAGKAQTLCGHCTAYGEIAAAGAKIEAQPSEFGKIFVYTSDNPELVTKLHWFAQKNREEMAKWAAEKTVAKPATENK